MVKEVQNPYKWKTPEERQEACKRLCEHIRQGLSVKSWPEADNETITSYCHNFPEDFDPDKIEAAKRESLRFWEALGIDGTQGKIMNFNATSWIFNMKNRAGWGDKLDINNPDGNFKTDYRPYSSIPIDKLERINEILEDDDEVGSDGD